MPKVCSTAFSLIFLVLAFGQLRSKFAELSLSACAGLAYKPNFVNLNFQFFSLPGLARLLENNVYKAAYPLHEVSKESLVNTQAGGCVAWLDPLIVRRLSKHLLIILLCYGNTLPPEKSNLMPEKSTSFEAYEERFFFRQNALFSRWHNNRDIAFWSSVCNTKAQQKMNNFDTTYLELSAADVLLVVSWGFRNAALILWFDSVFFFVLRVQHDYLLVSVAAMNEKLQKGVPHHEMLHACHYDWRHHYRAKT